MENKNYKDKVLGALDSLEKSLNKGFDTVKDSTVKGIDKLKEHIKTIGLYNNKAKNIIALSQTLVDKCNGEVPHNREIIESLAGVGRKTANVLFNVWWNEPTVAVDTHVLRLAKRLELSDKTTPLGVEEDLNKLPDEYKKHLNHWLVLFGRYTCKAQKPNCTDCPIAKFCRSTDKKL